jgi:hypothetical protein
VKEGIGGEIRPKDRVTLQITLVPKKSLNNTNIESMPKSNKKQTL